MFGGYVPSRTHLAALAAVDRADREAQDEADEAEASRYRPITIAPAYYEEMELQKSAEAAQ